MSDISSKPSALSQSAPLQRRGLRRSRSFSDGALMGARSVREGAAPKSRLPSLRLSQSLNEKDLLQFKIGTKPSGGEASPLLKSRGGRDMEETVGLFLKPRLDAPECLRQIHKSAIVSERPEGAILQYDSDFYAAFNDRISHLSDRELLLLHSKMNGEAARDLRSGIHLAGRKDIMPSATAAERKALRQEMRAVSERVESMDFMIRKEMQSRELEDQQKRPAARWKRFLPLSSTRGMLRAFYRERLPLMSAVSGEASAAHRRIVNDDFRALAREAPNDAARLDVNDPLSPRLPVTDIFLTDANRQDAWLDEGEGRAPVNIRDLCPDGAVDRKLISDKMVAFCGGDEDQALRLTGILSQKGIAYVWRMSMDGAFIPLPYGMEAGSGLIDGDKDRSFTVKRQSDGSVRIHYHQKVIPQYLRTMDGKIKPLDDRKSQILLDYEAELPAERGAPATLIAMRYEAHVSPGETVAELPG